MPKPRDRCRNTFERFVCERDVEFSQSVGYVRLASFVAAEGGGVFMVRRRLRRNLVPYFALLAAFSSWRKNHRCIALTPAGLALFAALAFAAPALAAPPPNDNRDDAQLLPSFPAVVHGTTVDATVERLDPQVSKCGRIDATVWYRIQSAPDGTIVATVKATAPLAPIVRIYRINPSNIAEMSCGTANA